MLPGLLHCASFLSIGLVAAVAFALAAYPGTRGFTPSFASPASPPPVANASTHCYRGIRTHDPDNPSAQCFTVVNGTFARVWGGASTDETPASSASSCPPRDDGPVDGFVMPGLWDGHGHLMAWGEFLHSVDLFNVQTIDGVRERLRTHLESHPGAGTKTFWLRGTGWDQDLYGRMPTARDLEQDPALRGVFAMLDRIDGHCIWVSRAVLDMLPPSAANATDPQAGQVIRDPGPGVFCDDAMDPVMKLWPRPDEQTKTRLVRDAMRHLNSVGLVGVHDAGTRPDDVKLYSRLADGRDWTVRVYSMLECAQTNAYCPADATRIARRDSRLWVQSVKLFADGALGSWGSAMLEPYADKTTSTGSLLLNTTAMTNLTIDFPVEPPNPFHGIYAAVTRKNPATGRGLDAAPHGWHTEEALTLDQALWGFTGATAYGAFLDRRAGLIREGAFADWIVLDRPMEDMSVDDLRTLTVKETWVAGEKVYERAGRRNDGEREATSKIKE
ncbi:hypothetical protein E4U53_007392 [Claviceps sorghi]|nr:hypothetical protein E4U53_007392 [Claviceps sorghi]